MRIGLDVAQHHLEWDELVDRVRFGEDAGFDGAWVFDHFKPLYGPRPVQQPHPPVWVGAGGLRRTIPLRLADAGFSYLVADWPEQGRRRVAEFVERLLPELLAR